MKKAFLFCLSFALFSGLIGAEMRSSNDSKTKKSSMRSADDDSKTKKSSMRSADDDSKVKKSSMRSEKPALTWNFSKGDVNPTINFYDVSKGNVVLQSGIKLKGDMSVKIECESGNKICYGGDFELAGKKFIAGCGDNCKELSSMSGELVSESCDICSTKTISRQTKVRKFEEKKSSITWNFSKGDVNPTISFYDTSKGNGVLQSGIKLKGNMSVKIECETGNKICYGGDFDLAGKNFVAGCGENCKELSTMSDEFINEACVVCSNTTVSKPTKVRKPK